MIPPSLVLAQNILKRTLQLVVMEVGSDGIEREHLYTKKKKDFLGQFDFGTTTVKFIDGLPPEEMEWGVLYIKRSGKIAWIRVRVDS